ncbi:MAG: urease accessory protein UreE [Pseudomonadota bacterium]
MSVVRATSVLRAPLDGPLHGTVFLDYSGRMLRRKKLTTLDGLVFWVDLPDTVSLNDGDGLALEGDSRVIEVRAADEPLLAVRGDLVRLAWHIGNRHTPCQVAGDHLLIQADPVLHSMLEGLGADVSPLEGPFQPEGGAYGTGRVLGHSHEREPAGGRSNAYEDFGDNDSDGDSDGDGGGE